MPCELLIIESDRNVPRTRTQWLAGEIVKIVDLPFQWQSELDTSVFVRFEVTDRTAEEMDEFFGRYVRVYELEVVAGPDPDGYRRIRVTNTAVNKSETLGIWTQETVDEVVAVWNAEYPDTELTNLGFNNRIWICEGTFAPGLAEDFERIITEVGFATMDKRSRWYITPAGMENIRQAGGKQTGTSAQLNQILRDAFED